MTNKDKKLFRNEKGATAIEYALIAALLSVAAIGALQLLGTTLDVKYDTISSSIPVL